nr:hypothetical protein Iba_chr07aCG11740 [Ipomoea batatas]
MPMGLRLGSGLCTLGQTDAMIWRSFGLSSCDGVTASCADGNTRIMYTRATHCQKGILSCQCFPTRSKETFASCHCGIPSLLLASLSCRAAHGLQRYACTKLFSFSLFQYDFFVFSPRFRTATCWTEPGPGADIRSLHLMGKLELVPPGAPGPSSRIAAGTIAVFLAVTGISYACPPLCQPPHHFQLALPSQAFSSCGASVGNNGGQTIHQRPTSPHLLAKSNQGQHLELSYQHQEPYGLPFTWPGPERPLS